MKVSRLKITGKYQQLIRNELEIIKTLHHENLARFEEAFLSENRLCIVMEYCDGGDLRKLMNDHRTAQSVHFIPTSKAIHVRLPSC